MHSWNPLNNSLRLVCKITNNDYFCVNVKIHSDARKHCCAFFPQVDVVVPIPRPMWWEVGPGLGGLSRTPNGDTFI